jgi:hypothetical protein
MAGVLWCVACVIICIASAPSHAAYGQDASETEAQSLGMLRFESTGRVRLDVVDPDGNTVNRDINEIEGAVIVSEDRKVVIEIPYSKPGDYQLHVNVSGSVNRLQHFGALVTNGVDTIQLADNELIVNVPVDAYVIRNDQDGIRIAAPAEDESPGISTNLIWILVGGAGLIVGIALFIIRSRKRKG